MVDKIDSDYHGVYFDVGNVLQFGFPQHWIEITGDRICKTDVKDYIKDIGNIRGFTYLLQGGVGWFTATKKFYGVGYDDYLTTGVVQPYLSHPEKLAFDTASSMNLILKEEV